MQALTRANWQFVDAPPPLADDQLHLWRIDLREALCRRDWLDAAELQRADKMSSESLRHRHCATRSMLRQLLGGYLGSPPASLAIRVDAQGKPHLAGDQVLHFNLSHTSDWALLAFSRHCPVGVDVEQIRELPNPERVAQRVMGNDELRELGTSEQPATTFMRLWTRMEARQKCLGQGVFGERISSSRVGMISFEAGPELLASLAWADPAKTPAIRYLGIQR